jgi:hypothetical protein
MGLDTGLININRNADRTEERRANGNIKCRRVPGGCALRDQTRLWGRDGPSRCG